jgi:hypothetical protein
MTLPNPKNTGKQTMPEGKSEYPDDVVAAAREAMNIVRGDGAVGVISRAILAERERCANVAEAEYEKRFDNRDGYPASRVHDFVVVARAIQRGILEPAPPSSTEGR